ncbi:MAG: VOC family protein [Solirubrobacterales bacterium]|nr:VOC family protein [Solirubrobacterales bacterium]
MSERSEYPPGVPCWIETLVADPEATMGFYSELFGWDFAGPGAMPGDPPGSYSVARLRDRDVAGIGSRPQASMPPAWTTYISVANVEEAVQRASAAGADVLAGPTNAAPAGRLAVLADPAGAVFGLWEAELRQGAQLVNEPSAWAMSGLQTTDPAGAKAFYGELFGWSHEAFDAGGAELTLCRMPGYVGGEPHQPVPRDVVAALLPIAGEQTQSFWGVDFWIDDADAAAAKAAQLGGSVLVAPHDTPGFRNTILADPNGAAFSVNERRL